MIGEARLRREAAPRADDEGEVTHSHAHSSQERAPERTAHHEDRTIDQVPEHAHGVVQLY